jgi:hypothetical protein
MIDMNIPFSPDEVAKYAIRYNKDNVISWLIDKNYSLSSDVKYLAYVYNKPYGVNPKYNVNDLRFICAEGDLKLLQDMTSRGYYPDPLAVDAAIARGHLDIIRWLKTIDMFSVYVNLEIAIEQGNFQMYNELKDILETVEHANLAAELGEIAIMTDLMGRGVNPDDYGITLAYINNQHNVVSILNKLNLRISRIDKRL